VPFRFALRAAECDHRDDARFRADSERAAAAAGRLTMTDTIPAENVELLENDEVRVLRWTLAPGSAIAWHRHPYPYVVVPISGGQLTFRGPAGDTPVDLVVGTATFRPAGTEHEVLNLGASTVVFVETEIKGRASGPG
jgi:quercetin dioxygenase-like cupin family protein